MGLGAENMRVAVEEGLDWKFGSASASRPWMVEGGDRRSSLTPAVGTMGRMGLGAENLGALVEEASDRPFCSGPEFLLASSSLCNWEVRHLSIEGPVVSSFTRTVNHPLPRNSSITPLTRTLLILTATKSPTLHLAGRADKGFGVLDLPMVALDE